ncbi:MDR family MFS transporter [Daejeonella lutea]|uniref:Predicted arabinose efflux permease, MFS family n=1 Tax=Daejeonella lutea TaxID=572036 RepID=A0A1T5AQP7_9SPHI|nr:MFS transporter [Daejeonella lutea]SKB37199.1 Predicted arabinose efflux permease, MFS family [Daejeonella lutea]
MIASPIQLYKAAYSGLSKENWYLSIVMFINRSGTMVVPFMTIYCTQKLNFSIVQAGMIMSLFGLGSIVGAFFGGKISDKFGFYYIQLGALLSGGVLFISLAFLETFLTLAVGTFLLSVCNEAFRPANSSAIAHYSSEKVRTRAYSLHRLAINLGWSFGGALGGFIASIDYHLLFYVDGCTNILAGLLLLKLLPAVKKEKLLKDTADSPPLRSAYRDKLYLAFIFLTIPFASSFFQFFILQPVFFKSEWHFTEQFIGGLMALNGIIIVTTEMVLVHNLEGRRNPLYFISVGIFVAALSYVALNILPPSAWAAVISVVLITFGEMLSMPFMNAFWISRSNENNRGEYSALYTIAWSIAQIIGPVYGAFLIQQGGFTLFWWFLTLICILSSLGFIIINYLEPLRKWKKSRYF